MLYKGNRNENIRFFKIEGINMKDWKGNKNSAHAAIAAHRGGVKV